MAILEKFSQELRNLAEHPNIGAETAEKLIAEAANQQALHAKIQKDLHQIDPALLKQHLLNTITIINQSKQYNNINQAQEQEQTNQNKYR